MDKREVKIDYLVYEKTYPSVYKDLCIKAIETVQKAYSIYSHFSVGAAVLMDNGEIVIGSNQENVAYPSGMCAERTAIYYAGTIYAGIDIKAIAIAAFNKGEQTNDIISPCGACRQVMAEVIKRYGKDFDVIMIGKERTVQIKASGLLPFSFDFK